jgi:uncharacterized membrane protein/protein-disulfide isomerase
MELSPLTATSSPAEASPSENGDDVVIMKGGMTGPPPMTLWLLRGLALLGFALATFLLVTHLLALRAAHRASMPFCSGLSWVDCDSVLHSRYAYWFGIPVSLPAVGVYVLVLIGLFAIRRVRPNRSWPIWLLTALAMTILGSAAWFTYVQIAILRQICTWCMFEHLVGTVLALLLMARFGSAGWPWRTGAPIVGLILVSVLIAGQTLMPGRHVEVVQWSADEERWVESGSNDETWSLLDGRVVLNREAHPVIGLTGAREAIIEVVDFTCPRCARFSHLLNYARRELGPSLAIAIVFCPLDAECNPTISNTPERYRYACELARVAVAVWLAEPRAYADFHYWLYDHQEGMTPQKAEAEAARRIGTDRLRELLAGTRVDEVIQRDVKLADKLGVRHLPGLFVGDQQFSALPATVDGLVRDIRWVLSKDKPQPASLPARP